ncbi:MAG: class I SAM-dependent methyltransferase [Rhodobiaceae bacterium]|nr:class I SAM-dependent methyltransferase [Rhodobiaceae bacterium]
MPPTPTSDDPDYLRGHWDAEYEAGRWDFLRGLKQLSRSGLIAAWLKEAGALGHVLDVGCGEALLHPFLKPYGMARYTGVDVSPKALDLARARTGPDDTLVEATLEGFEAGDTRYSAVVFNEVLYFPRDPAGELRRYRAFLAPGGVIAISMYAPNRPESGAHKAIAAVWAETDGDGWTVLDDLTIHGEIKDVTWKLRLVQRKD